MNFKYCEIKANEYIYLKNNEIIEDLINSKFNECFTSYALANITEKISRLQKIKKLINIFYVPFGIGEKDDEEFFDQDMKDLFYFDHNLFIKAITDEVANLNLTTNNIKKTPYLEYIMKEFLIDIFEHFELTHLDYYKYMKRDLYDEEQHYFKDERSEAADSIYWQENISKNILSKIDKIYIIKDIEHKLSTFKPRHFSKQRRTNSLPKPPKLISVATGGGSSISYKSPGDTHMDDPGSPGSPGDSDGESSDKSASDKSESTDLSIDPESHLLTFKQIKAVFEDIIEPYHDFSTPRKIGGPNLRSYFTYPQRITMFTGSYYSRNYIEPLTKLFINNPIKSEDTNKIHFDKLFNRNENKFDDLLRKRTGSFEQKIFHLTFMSPHISLNVNQNTLDYYSN